MERDARRARIGIAAVIGVGVLLRLIALRSTGFATDVGTFMAWAERLASIGPWAFYEPGYFSDYPPAFLYVLWLLGELLDGEALRLAVKAASIPADVAIAILAARLVWRHAGGARAALAAGLWMLSPAQIFAGPFWGQVDAVGTVPFMGALLAAGSRRWALAGALAGVALMTKPQFGIALIVVAVAAAITYVRDADWRPAARVAAAASAAVLLIGIPFRSGPAELIALVRSASETYPYTSLYAFNVWAIAADFWKPDDSYVLAGALLLIAGIAGSCVPLWWRRDTAAILAAGALAAFAFYLLPTRAHERYIFPAFALLLPFAAMRTPLLVAYAGMSLTFFATLYFAFTRYPQQDITVPPLLESTLFSRGGQIVLALVLLCGAAFFAWRLLTRDGALVADRASAAPAAPGVGTQRRPWQLPPGLAAGRRPTRRDIAVAALVAVTVLATRGYRLDHPRDMYFDEVYHARTAFEFLAQREPYEWTHPHLAKYLIAVGIVTFGRDAVTGRESVPAGGLAALAVANDGTRVYATDDGTIHVARRDGHDRRALASLGAPVRAMALGDGRVHALTDAAIVDVDLRTGAQTSRTLATSGSVTSMSVAAGRVVTGGPLGVALYAPAAEPLVLRIPAVALTAAPGGAELYVLDQSGTVHVIESFGGTTKRTLTGGATGGTIAHAAGRIFVGRSNEPVLDVYDVDDGSHETVALANDRTGNLTSGVRAMATVPRTQFVYAVVDGRAVVIEPHGASPYAAIPARGELIAVDGTGDHLLVGSTDLVERIEAGRHAFAWRMPGVIAAALLAFVLVLLARRLFASTALPPLVGAAVVLDGSMFAQARIAMNDIYVALFIVAAWYFVVAAHRPRWSAAADLVIAGVLIGLGTATKWAAFYTIAGIGVASLVATAIAYERGRPGGGGPLDLFGGRGRNFALLVVSFGVIPLALYAGAYLRWFGGPSAPYGWDFVELTKQMYGYHSALTAPHAAGSPWWSWPIVLKPVYWYLGPSESGTNGYIYDAGNVVLFWGALGAFIWCAVAAVRARSVPLAFVVFALLVQYVAWVPITRVLFFYHFFTALPFYLLGLAAALAMLWEGGRRQIVLGYLALAAGAFAFFYPFISGQPVSGAQAAAFFILPTWQYDCQFYPQFVCNVPFAPDVSAAALISRIGVAAAAAAAVGLAVVAWQSLRSSGRGLGGRSGR